MLVRKKYLLAFFIVTIFVAAIVDAKMDGDAPPDLVMQKTTTKGLLGSIISFFWPFISVGIQLVNSILIHTKNEQLPCTMYNLSKLQYSCTPFQATVIDDSTTLAPTAEPS
ncbi:uncharacterized protein LOC130671355 [Microplitis mediator]|uniref:uncharacterized protein LOC130671355 n=1 Tax=Microplitis mediator TaxID=375433 RepID=UPI0025553FFC|nr:uncharacterized protein LOC130671355 [Microplitis mediator]